MVTSRERGRRRVRARAPICYLLSAICYCVLEPLRVSRKELRVVNPAIVRCVSTIRVFAVDVDKTAIPQNFFEHIVGLTLDRRDDHRVDTDDGCEKAHIGALELLTSPTVQWTGLIDPMPHDQGNRKRDDAIKMKFELIESPHIIPFFRWFVADHHY